MGNDTQGQVILTKREFSSGGVVFKQENDETLWLVRRTSASELFPKTYWMLPKGWIDDSDGDKPGPIASGKVKATEEILQETAIREVAEETGVEAKVANKVGTVKFFYTHPQRGKILKFVTFYLMERMSDLPEGFDGETSEIKWLPFDEAYRTLTFSREKEMLKKAAGILEETSLV